MDITIAIEEGRVPVTVMHVSGNIDSNSYQAFQTQADELIKNGSHHILVDMTHAPYVSSAGLRAFQTVFTQLRAANRDVSEDEMRKGISDGTYKSPYFKLLNLSREAETAFKTAGFDMFIESFSDLKAAISSF